MPADKFDARQLLPYCRKAQAEVDTVSADLNRNETVRGQRLESRLVIVRQQPMAGLPLWGGSLLEQRRIAVLAILRVTRHDDRSETIRH